MVYDVIVIGGGAAGYFYAINLAAKNRNLKIVILEKQKTVLSKVRVSGGGRCNVTRHCFAPNELVKFYPRGAKELLPLFYGFNPAHTIEWFRERGVELKTEPDGRMFPAANTSRAIIDCFVKEAVKYNIDVMLNTEVNDIEEASGSWKVAAETKVYQAEKIFIGSGNSTKVWGILEKLGHSIVPPVPSLFSFMSGDNFVIGLAGLARDVSINLAGSKLTESGALLFTHQGVSGPAVLKLSSKAARQLAAMNYQFTINVNFLINMNFDDTVSYLKNLKNAEAVRLIRLTKPFDIPQRLWEKLMLWSEINMDTKWKDCPQKKINLLSSALTKLPLHITGKSTNKEEFVTCGGVERKEIEWKRMESKIAKNIFFGGEVIDVDALTGGFNFQAAWTTAFTAADTKNR